MMALRLAFDDYKRVNGNREYATNPADNEPIDRRESRQGELHEVSRLCVF